MEYVEIFRVAIYGGAVLVAIVALGWEFIIKRGKDPEKECEVYLENKGCTHFGGLNCDIDTCPIRKEYLKDTECL